MTLILSINPGATSTKCALFEDEKELFREEIRYSLAEIEKYASLKDQLNDRYNSIIEAIQKHGYSIEDIELIVSRGGILPPVEAGALLVDDHLVDYLLNKSHVAHPANLGAAIAHEIVKQTRKGVAYIYDPISVDQLAPIARISGLEGIERKSVGHILNSRAVAHKYAKEQGKAYDALNMIVVHAGTGITITIHHGGRMIDLISDDEGPFSPERTGGLPLRSFLDLCYNESKDNVVKAMRHRGGLVSYLDTNDILEIEAMIDSGDEKAKLILEAMAYQIAKYIGQLAPVVNGNVDAIIISGGFARSQRIMNWIDARVSFIAPVILYPGEFELEALALGGLRAYRKEEPLRNF